MDDDRGRRSRILPAAVLAALIAGGTWFSLQRNGESPPAVAASAAPTTAAASSPSGSPTGAIVWATDGTRAWPPPIHAQPMPDGEATHPLVPGGDRTVDWDWSPDLQHAVWVESDPHGPGATLLYGSAVGPGAFAIGMLNSELDYRGRAFSNDGASFAYAAFTRDGTSLRVVDLATLAQLEVASWNETVDIDVDWSPDATRLVVARADGGVTTMDPDGGNVQQISDLHAWRIGWSPTAPLLVAEVVQGDASGVWVLGSDGSAPTRLSPPDVNELDPVWSPDGGWIAFSSHRDQPAKTPPKMRDQPQFGTGIYVMRADGSRVVQIAPPPTDVGWAEVWDWLPGVPSATAT